MSDGLWQQLTNAGMTTTTQTPVNSVEEGKPWYIRLLHGFSGWLASWFILGFLALGLFELFDNAMAAGVVGVLLSLPAFLVYRKAQASDFISQMVLVFSLAGQLAVAVALFDGLGFSHRAPLIWLAMYQVLLFFLMSDYLHRLLSALFAMAAAFYGLFIFTYLPLVTVVLAGVFVWLWMNRESWRDWHAMASPFAVALTVVLLLMSGTQISNVHWYGLFGKSPIHADYLNQIQLLSQVLTGALLLYVLFLIAKENRSQWQTTAVQKISAVILVLVVAVFVSGLAIALLMLMVGVARQNRWLQVLGVSAALGFISWFYYDLSATLLIKSLSLVVLGALLLFIYWIIKPSKQADEQHEKQQLFVSMSRKVVLASVLLSFVAVNHAVWQKERLLKNGQSIYLALAPVDPRSLMQGDYMRLRFAISQVLARENKEQQDYSGLLVLDVGDNQVATFNSFYQGQDLGHNQVKLAYKFKHNQYQIGAQTFFFQEGQRKQYDAAQYGEFVVESSGKALLKSLRDAELKLIGLNRLD
ncbi:GDYXXLXY domain-containing protein [Marinicella rhabdoformis]|uniref:GDYXXLXY domain-containing protein n=1 Tax=Marinicella rhabdoformis TaxID=2580566 RepID=UPI0015CFD4A3|nr:GDYXXLXY domain-containing protein [Marinicella rhabdoformis]